MQQHLSFHSLIATRRLIRLLRIVTDRPSRNTTSVFSSVPSIFGSWIAMSISVMFFNKAARSPASSPTTTRFALIMADAHVLTTPIIPDYDDCPYDLEGNSLLPPSNISPMIIDAGEAAKSRRRGRLNARFFPTVALMNETVVCSATP
ncbi:hypothetical protein FRC02_003809, partial [Tulasnella sp. 418]